MQSGFSDAFLRNDNQKDVAENGNPRKASTIGSVVSKCTSLIGTVITNHLNSVGSIHNHRDKGTRGLDWILETETRPNHRLISDFVSTNVRDEACNVGAHMIDRSQTGSVPERWSLQVCKSCGQTKDKEETDQRPRGGGRAPVLTPSIQSSDREMCASPPPTDKSQVSVGKGGARACLKGRTTSKCNTTGGCTEDRYLGYVPPPRYVPYTISKSRLDGFSVFCQLLLRMDASPLC